MVCGIHVSEEGSRVRVGDQDGANLFSPHDSAVSSNLTEPNMSKWSTDR